jgi:hypothetical protein
MPGYSAVSVFSAAVNGAGPNGNFPELVITAADDLSGAPFSLVAINADGRAVLASIADPELVVGALINQPQIGEQAVIRLFGPVRVVNDSIPAVSILAKALVVPSRDTDGQVENAAAAGHGAVEFILGRALEDIAAGDSGLIFLHPHFVAWP